MASSRPHHVGLSRLAEAHLLTSAVDLLRHVVRPEFLLNFGALLTSSAPAPRFFPLHAAPARRREPRLSASPPTWPAAGSSLAFGGRVLAIGADAFTLLLLDSCAPQVQTLAGKTADSMAASRRLLRAPRCVCCSSARAPRGATRASARPIPLPKRFPARAAGRIGPVERP